MSQAIRLAVAAWRSRPKACAWMQVSQRNVAVAEVVGGGEGVEAGDGVGADDAGLGAYQAGGRRARRPAASAAR